MVRTAKVSLAVWLGCFLLLGFTAARPELLASDLQRGPYLQTATPEGITLRWRTDLACESVVKYGTQTNDLAFTASDTNSTTEHEVIVTGLAPATQYFYSVGSFGNILAEGPDCYFITPPPAGEAKPTRVWVIGDSGQTADDGQSRMRNAYYQYTGARHTDVWLALGDNAYFNGNDSEYQTNFFDIYPKLLRQTAIWSTVGNHEIYSVSANGFPPYFDIFSFPTNSEAGGVPSGVEEYYSFDHANIHFICLDSTISDPATNGTMANWLRADLAATTRDWIIAFWHHPPYSKGIHDSDTEADMVAMRQNIVPILEARGVDLVLCGHSHVYERSYLLHGHYGASSTLQPEMILDQGSGREKDTGPYIKPASGPGANQGTVYVEAGSSGYARGSGGHHPAMYFDEVQMGSLVLDIYRNRLDAVFLRETGVVDDSFTILKSDPEPLRLVDIKLENGWVILRWKSLRGQSYRIEHSAGWQVLNWQSASDPITATGATTAWTNVVSPGSIGLYRVVELPTSDPAKPAKALPACSKAAGSEQQVSCSRKVLEEALLGLLPFRPVEESPLTAEWVSDCVVCDTTYWRRRIRPSASCPGSHPRVANADSRISWRQVTSRG